MMVVAMSYSNLHMQLGMFKEAKDDCDAALELCYTCKTLLRRGSAYIGLKEYGKAILDFRQVLHHEPGNRYTMHTASPVLTSFLCNI